MAGSSSCLKDSHTPFSVGCHPNSRKRTALLLELRPIMGGVYSPCTHLVSNHTEKGFVTLKNPQRGPHRGAPVLFLVPGWLSCPPRVAPCQSPLPLHAKKIPSRFRRRNTDSLILLLLMSVRPSALQRLSVKYVLSIRSHTYQEDHVRAGKVQNVNLRLYRETFTNMTGESMLQCESRDSWKLNRQSLMPWVPTINFGSLWLSAGVVHG